MSRTYMFSKNRKKGKYKICDVQKCFHPLEKKNLYTYKYNLKQGIW